MKENILVSNIENGIFFITLNRPEAANALSIQLLNELKDTINQCKADRSIRCIILSGSGERAFCAGADLKERSLMTDNQVGEAVALIGECIHSLEELPQPVIAAINGVALGGGLEIALACDLIIASDTAKIGLTETSLGIIPGAGGTQRLPRLIGLAKAKELIYTARKLDAMEAFQIGLIQYVTKADLLKGKAIEIAEKIALNAPLAIQQAKKCMNKGIDVDLKTGLKFERLAYETIIPTKDRLEGLQAFKEKRLPRFIGQ
ncbi:enoyl-CoA hydratase [Metabacillus litoralis]|uniref:Enoyl-CoA hydratase n=1 Tax=Metabacillus litoralis TaxID=152268 RepID=A0A5C6WAW3_9BACI|nr:enoyl-CoA hydratase [Metabacillus litoralis]TXC93029.1 enoyl-CoA hydratase [Metabacillus litoralis]